MKTLLINGFEISSLGSVYFEDDDKKYVVIGDLHIGLEKYMRDQGVFMSKKQLPEIKKGLKELVKRYGSDTILIINGDLKHDFKKQGYEDAKEIKEFIRFAMERFRDIMLIRGNHDNYLINIADYLGKDLVDFVQTSRFFITHGHKSMILPTNKHIILHHEHPSITLRDDVNAKIKIRAYLIGRIRKNKDYYVIVVPAFSYYSPGIDVLSAYYERDSLISQFDVEDFEVYGIYEDEIYKFDKLRKLREAFY